MKQIIEYWNNIDWGYTLLCILATPFFLFFLYILIATTTPDVLDGWIK